MSVLLLEPSLRRAGALARSALSWWGAELAGLAPEPLRRLLIAESDLVMEVAERAMVISRGHGTARRELARFSVAEGRSAAIAPGLRAELEKQSCLVLLPPEQVVRRTFDLPAAATRELRRVVGYEIDRQTPFRSEEACFDCRIVARNRSTGRVRAALAAASRHRVDAALDLARASGLRPVSAGVASEQGPPFVFWRQEPEKASRLAVRVELVLVGLAAAFVAVGLAAAMVHQHSALTQVRQDAARLRAEMQVVDRLRAEVQDLNARVDFLPRRRNEPPAVQLLNDLARALPDMTWLHEVELDRREMRIQGYSSSAPALIAMIEGTAQFANARFRSPVTQGPRPNLERFHLSFDVIPRTP